MILLLDQGNSRLKWASLTDAGEFLGRGAMASRPGPEELHAVLANVPQGSCRIGLASVLDETERLRITELTRQLVGVTPHTFTSGRESAGLRNGYLEPDRLGVDRWLAMLGARSIAGGALLVVSAGTALTLDAVRADGLHLGGLIVPGRRLQLESLAQGTAGIGLISTQAADGWGQMTDTAVANGVRLALAATVERALIELSRGLDDTCRVVLTGGDAGFVAAGMSVPGVVVDHDLLFRGMLVELLQRH